MDQLLNTSNNNIFLSNHLYIDPDLSQKVIDFSKDPRELHKIIPNYKTTKYFCLNCYFVNNQKIEFKDVFRFYKHLIQHLCIYYIFNFIYTIK